MNSKNHVSLLVVFALFFLFQSSITAIASDIRIDDINYPNLVKDNIFWFVQISDIHVGDQCDPPLYNLDWVTNKMPDIIKPEFVVATGDLTDNVFVASRDSQWGLYRGYIYSNSEFRKIFYDIPGNHDRYGDPEWDGNNECNGCVGSSGYMHDSYRGARERLLHPDNPIGEFMWTWPPLNMPAENGTYLFISANTCDEDGRTFLSYGLEKISDTPALSDNELSYIDGILKRFYEEKKVAPDPTNLINPKLAFIFGHHGLYTRSSGTLTDPWFCKDVKLEGTALPGIVDRGVGGNGLQNIFRNRQVAAYLYGHTHQEEEFFDSSSLQLNTGSLADGHYRIVAIDNNGVSTTAQLVNMWPIVLITSPINKKLGGTNPYAYVVPKSKTNPIRALIFNDPAYCTISSVTLAIDTIEIGAMQQVSNNPGDRTYNVWEGYWDTTNISGEHTISAQAKCDLPSDYVPFPFVLGGDTITVDVEKEKQALDLIFTVDVTGSMWDDIDAVKASATSNSR